MQLTPLQQTLLITLGGRADESLLEDSLLKDHHANVARQQIDFDFSRVKLSRDGIIALAVRARTIDQQIATFLHQYPSATIVHIGCGLDSRVYRVDPGPEVAWWEVDFPEVIRLRRQLYAEREGCRFREASVLDSDWLAGISSDEPALIVAEGIFAYFSYGDVCHVLQDVVDHFRTGEILFDAYNRWGISFLNCLPSIRRGGAKLQFSLDDPQQLPQAVPGLQLVEARTGAPPDQIARTSLPMRLGFRFAQSIGPLRRMGQVVRYQFGLPG